VAVVPQIPLTFEANARSLEPKNSRAGTALSLIMQKMPVRWEPVLGIVRATTEQELHDFWKAISQHWSDLQRAGKIKSYSTTNAPVATQEQKNVLARELPVAGIPITLSGWSYTLTDLVPWSHRQLLLISALMAVFDASLLAVLYRDLRLWLVQVITLALAVAAMIASMKLFHLPLNLLNVLAFRLVLAIGVDYGIYVLLVWQRSHEVARDLTGVIKPVALAGLTAIAGFGSLGWAHNPTLSGLGIACAIGLFWSL